MVRPLGMVQWRAEMGEEHEVAKRSTGKSAGATELFCNRRRGRLRSTIQSLHFGNFGALVIKNVLPPFAAIVVCGCKRDDGRKGWGTHESIKVYIP